MSTTLPSVLEKVWDTVSQTPYAADALGTAWGGWKSWSVDLGARLDQPWQLVMVVSVVAAIGAWRIVGDYVQNLILAVLALGLLVVLGWGAYLGYRAIEAAFEAHPVTAPLTTAAILTAVVLVCFAIFSESLDEPLPILFGLLLPLIFVLSAIFAAFAAHPVIMSVTTLGISTASLLAALWLTASREDADLFDWVPPALFVVGVPAALVAAVLALPVWGIYAAGVWVVARFTGEDDPAGHELAPAGVDVDASTDHDAADRDGEVATLHQMFKAPAVTRPDDDPDPAS